MTEHAAKIQSTFYWMVNLKSKQKKSQNNQLKSRTIYVGLEWGIGGGRMGQEENYRKGY